MAELTVMLQVSQDCLTGFVSILGEAALEWSLQLLVVSLRDLSTGSESPSDSLASSDEKSLAFELLGDSELSSALPPLSSLCKSFLLLQATSVGSSDSVVESRLSLAAFRGCFRVLSLAFCDKLALLREDLQLTVDGVVVLGNGRGKSPLKALIAEAAAEAGYSPKSPGFCLFISGCFKGGFPKSELLAPAEGELAKV